MLTAHSLRKSFGPELILDSISFSLSPGERMGLVGPNGCGKTTLLRLLAQLDAPDFGAVQYSPPDLRVGYLPQGLTFSATDSLGDFITGAPGGLPALTADFERASEVLASHVLSGTERSGVKSKDADYETTLARLTAADGVLKRAPGLLAALGLGHVPLDAPVASLSGGQKTRLALARVLAADPQLLLLDEPTNHLDIQMLEWLEQWLLTFRGAALVVSHDRAFLDQTVTRILELNPHTRTAKEYAGNYSDYIETKEQAREKQWRQWRDQQEDLRQMRQDIARTKEQSASVERNTTPRQPGVRRIAKKVARKALAREKKLERYLASDERVDKPKTDWQMKLDFGAETPSGQAVLVTESLAVGYGEAALLRDLNLHVKRGARVALIGPNGCGKTTLIRTMAGALPPLAGRVRLGANVRLGYMAQEQESLDPALNAFTTLQNYAALSETDTRSFLHYFLFEDDEVFTPVGSLSFGERARLALAGLVAQGCNFLLLDEPINHLDIPSRARFERALSAFEGTTLAVVHDRYFIEQFATTVWAVEGDNVRCEEV